jgi:aminomethyltransferase
MKTKRESPLLEIHKSLNANIGEFAGWIMPMSYGDYMKEHLSVRTEVGVFDISHMGRLRVTGRDSLLILDYLTTRKIVPIKNIIIGPNAFLNENGGFLDDVLVYVIEQDNYLLVTNAINKDKIKNWLLYWRDIKKMDFEVKDLTDETAMIAIQGKKAKEISILNSYSNLKPLTFIMSENPFLLVSRSGWTGEDGFEVIGEERRIREIFLNLVNLGIQPCGLISRDSLRLEMGFLLYGEDFDENISPVEARYWVFDISKEFLGKEKVMEKLIDGVEKLRVGLKFKKGERFIPRKGLKIAIGGKEIGEITSGHYSPLLNRAIAMGYIKSTHFFLGLNTEVAYRGKTFSAKLSDFPLI